MHKILIAATLMVAALFNCTPAGADDFSVKVNRGRLSVKADDSRFGSLMDRIAKDAGFELSISPDVAEKTLSTEFMDLEMEKGIQRLMGLIRHRNFFIFYGRDGDIKKIEIYGSGRGPAAVPPAHPGIPGQRTMPMVIEPPHDSTDMDSASDKVEKNIVEAPYIPPASMPEYIPPRRGIGSGK